MAKNWAGDGVYVLPARKVEPYRLWFEYLKLAYQDPDIKVDKRIYKSWGDVENLKFDDWWSDYWRDLFAVETGIRVMERDETIGNSNSAIAIRVPLSLDANTAIQELRELLFENGIGNREAPRVKGKFALTEGSVQGFEKQMNSARCMLRLYGYWLKHEKADKRKRIEKAAIEYYDWMMDWDDQIVSKGWNRPRPYKPGSFRTYVEYVRAKQPGKRAHRGGGAAYKAGQSVDDARRQVARYIRKARKIAENVAAGEFPGKY
jgi:hypothetical protein